MKNGRKEKKPVTKERILSTIGLAYRASLLASGSDSVEMAIRSGAAGLLILSEDGSEKQREKLFRIAKEEEVETRYFGTCEELGKAVGRDVRIAHAILDPGLALKLKQQIDELNGNEMSVEDAE